MYVLADGTERKLYLREVIIYLVISLLLNSMGNGLTVACNMGSAMWTASAANLAHDFHFSIATILIVYGIVSILVNVILLQHFDWHRIIGNLIFIFPYGYFVSLWANFFRSLGVTSLPIPTRILLDVIGIICLGIAISIYQRVNVILHPNDDMTNIIRFKYVKGNPVAAQLLNFAFPSVVIVVLWVVFKEVVAVNIGTIIALFFQGAVIGWTDKHLFKRLKHRLKFIKDKKETLAVE
ncbi:YczE/YyaS/YitT family protein [Periweissella fabalis]|uniref:Sugar specific permease n=1 Tax=Periweissella fabalis TaxID=1070421 RepID=A0A7X6N1Q3_9LACO|nr:hypothetical protein [Periweissella fabalis]MCM0599340.1 hypothetical protein [Periweissella fabalis]NKZ23619.1 hypothetical protein [Periweissella fabalis]